MWQKRKPHEQVQFDLQATQEDLYQAKLRLLNEQANVDYLTRRLQHLEAEQKALPEPIPFSPWRGARNKQPL